MIKPEEKRLHTRVKLQICTDEPVIGPGVAQLLELLQADGLHEGGLRTDGHVLQQGLEDHRQGRNGSWGTA